MPSKVYIEQICEVLRADEKSMRDQVIHINGQIVYNQRMQKILNQQLCAHALTAGKSKTRKSKTVKKIKK